MQKARLNSNGWKFEETNNLRYSGDITLLAENNNKLEWLLMKFKEESIKQAYTRPLKRERKINYRRIT